jgi:hypothetical protein
MVQKGDNPNPGAPMVLLVATGASEPVRFLAARTNSAAATPKIEWIHSIGNCHVAALGQPNNLHGHTFAFVGDQVGEQLPSTFLKLVSF